MKTVVTIYLALFILTLCSCKKTDVGGTTAGNPLVSFTMTGSSAPRTVAKNQRLPYLRGLIAPAIALPPPILVDSTNAAISLNEAWISVKQVEFKSTESVSLGEVDGDSVSFETPTAVNLIASTVQSFGQVRIPSPLRRIKMQLHNVDVLPSGAPAGLANNSFYWQGTVGARSFTFTSTEGYEYELGGANGVALVENSNILLSIQIANLFRKIDMTNVVDGAVISQSSRVPATNPCPLIDASASDIYSCFKDGLKSEANLGNDDEADGELSGDDTVR